MTYTLTLRAKDGSESYMSLSDVSSGPETAGGQRMTGAQIKDALDAGDVIRVKMFDNDPGFLVLAVEAV